MREKREYIFFGIYFDDTGGVRQSPNQSYLTWLQLIIYTIIENLFESLVDVHIHWQSQNEYEYTWKETEVKRDVDK